MMETISPQSVTLADQLDGCLRKNFEVKGHSWSYEVSAISRLVLALNLGSKTFSKISWKKAR
jgi:hypothetical protein